MEQLKVGYYCSLMQHLPGDSSKILRNGKLRQSGEGGGIKA